MKKIIFMLVLAMSCERVLFGGVGVGNIIRCENDEVIKYLLDNNPNAEIIHLNLTNYQDLPIIKNDIPGTLTLIPNELYEGFYIAQIKKTK